MPRILMRAVSAEILSAMDIAWLTRLASQKPQPAGKLERQISQLQLL